MQTDLYADLYFLVNASMDLLCLMITGSLLHRRLPRLRGLLAAALGGGYALLSLLLGWSGLSGLLLDALAALLLCALAFGRRQGLGSTLLRVTPLFWFVSITLGGVMTALFGALNRLHLPWEKWEGQDLSVWSFAIVGSLAALLTAGGGGFWKRTKSLRTVTVEAVLFGTPITLCALEDSGNLLRDPISGKSVIVADLNAVRVALPKDLTAACEKNDCSLWFSSHSPEVTKTRPVVAHTATGKRLLPAILPDTLFLTRNGERYPADYLIAPTLLSAPLPKDGNAVIAAD